MRVGTVRTTTAAGMLAVVMLSALGPSMAAAFEAAEDQTSPAVLREPIAPASEPKPPKAEPKPKPQKAEPKPPKAMPTSKPKPKPTPLEQNPSVHTPGEQAPGNPNPVRPDEPPAAPVLPVPGPADARPLVEGEPAAPLQPTGQPGAGPAATAATGQGAPLALGVGPPPSRVHLVVAGATVSGIAAVAAWLVLGGRRRERLPVRTPQPSATTFTLADGMQLDLEVVVSRPEGAPRPRYPGRVPATAGTTLWRDEDDRPRWLRRFDQRPAQRRVPPSSVGLDEDEMPWLAGVTWPADENHRQN